VADDTRPVTSVTMAIARVVADRAGEGTIGAEAIAALPFYKDLATAAVAAYEADLADDAELAAEKLRAAGYVVVAPDDATYRQAVDRLNDQHYAIRQQIDEAMTKLGLAMRKFDVLVDPGHEMVNSFYRVADMVRELRAELRILRKIHPRARPMRQCRGCGRAGGELTENGCPTCGPDTDITEV
jgi:rRNA maturation endonuclease Nob1